MAEFIEEPIEEFDTDLLESHEELSDINPSEPEEEVIQEEEVEEEVLPEKYQGKSVGDIIHMHQEAEKLVGRQSTEVGELRRLVDDYVKPTHENTATTQQDPEEAIDFFDNPQEAVNQAISNNPALKEIQELQKNLKQQEIKAKLNVNHSDYVETLNNPDFAEWVKSSKVRMELYQRADGSFDYDAADELLTNWGERSKKVTEAKDTAKKDVKEQRKAASTGTSKGTGETSSRKIYRRTDIMNLMRNDPERYLELSDEILKAYAEKRVR